jgi:hypothetical protein
MCTYVDTSVDKWHCAPLDAEYTTADRSGLTHYLAKYSQMLVSNHHPTQRNNPENHEMYLHRRENFESRIRSILHELLSL